MKKIITSLPVIALALLSISTAGTEASVDDPINGGGGTPIATCQGCDKKFSGAGGTAYSAEHGPEGGSTLHMSEKYTNFTDTCSGSSSCTTKTCKFGWQFRIKVTGTKAKIIVEPDGGGSVTYPDVGNSWRVVKSIPSADRVCSNSTTTVSGYMFIHDDTGTAHGYTTNPGCTDCDAVY